MRRIQKEFFEQYNLSRRILEPEAMTQDSNLGE